MNALEQLREEVRKREEKLGKQIEEREGEEKEIQKVKEKDFRITEAIYIELFTSRPPPMF